MENKGFLNRLELINDQLNLAHYWIILLKYKRIILLTPLFFGLLGFFIALNLNPIFQSQATLVIEESSKNIVNIEEVYGAENRGGGVFRNLNYINNQIQIIESDEVLGSILLDKKNKAKALMMHKKLPKNFLSTKGKLFSYFKTEEKNLFDLKVYIKKI